MGIRTSTVVICSPGLLIEKTIKPNHQQQGIIENFPIGDMIWDYSFKLNKSRGTRWCRLLGPETLLKLSNFSMSHISFHSTWYFCFPLWLSIHTHTTVKYWTSLTLISLKEGSNFNQIIITQAVVFCDLRIQTKTLRDSASLWSCTNQIQVLFSFIQNPPIISCMCVIFCSVQ